MGTITLNPALHEFLAGSVVLFLLAIFYFLPSTNERVEKIDQKIIETLSHNDEWLTVVDIENRYNKRPDVRKRISLSLLCDRIDELVRQRKVFRTELREGGTITHMYSIQKLAHHSV